MSNAVGTVLLTREQIEERAREIGEEIARDYEGEEVYLIGTLRSSSLDGRYDEEYQK